MTNSKSAHRRRNAPPVRRVSWGQRQLTPNKPANGVDEVLEGLPTLEEFQAFFSILRGKSTPVVPTVSRPLLPTGRYIALTFSPTEGGLGGVIVMDVSVAAILGGRIRRLRTGEIKSCLESQTLNEEMTKALRYVGRRLNDMVSSTEGPRLYFNALTGPFSRLPEDLQQYAEVAERRLQLALDFGPLGTGCVRIML